MRLIKSFFEKFSVKKLHDDLDYWIFIQCGEDIVELKDQRAEYQHLVQKNRFKCEKFINGTCVSVVRNDDIPMDVLKDLALELKLPFYKRPTFWHLVRLNFKRLFSWK